MEHAGDGRLALDAPYDPERFTVKEQRVVVGHTGYRFTVDPRGDAVTLTRLEGTFQPRTNLDVGARAPCLWELPKLAALR